MNLQYLASKVLGDIKVSDLVAVYPYGSRVYGTATKNSDYDYIVILKKKKSQQYSDNLININFYTPEEHQKRLDDHEISALECYFLPREMVLFTANHPLNKENVEFKFKLDLGKLRHSLSAKSSNSWVKAKKKLTVEKDYDVNIGKKSLFHAMRIITFGIQIAMTGRIVDYGACNHINHSISLQSDMWPELFETYKKYYNRLLSDFRVVAPKEIA